ncbi:MAG: glycosyl transferase group 1 family protein [Chloroflexi bacterium]|nr:glycosyl transferase group 1 family protein [Chloroflexota bacterium]
MGDRPKHLRLLAVQTTSSVTSEVIVLHTLLKSLYPLSRENGIPVEVLLIQGIDGHANKAAGRQAAGLFRQIPNVTVLELNVGKLGQHDSPRFDRVMKIRDLLYLQLARRSLLAKVHTFRPHVVYSAQQVWDLRIATPLAGSLACAQVIHLHYNVGPALGPGVVDALRRAQMVITVSDFIRDDAIAHGVAPSRVHALYNSITVPRELSLQERLAVRQAVRAELGLPEDALVVGMAGRISPSKGQLQLMEAMVPSLIRDPRVHLVLAGSENPARNGISDRIMHAAQKHNVTSQVHLLGHRSDVPRILDAIDLFAHPTRNDPCPLAVLEAAAHGLPIVAWREGGTATLVRDQETGLLVEPMDVDGLAHALQTLITDQGMRDAMGKMARERTASIFNPDAAAADFLSLLEMERTRELRFTHREGTTVAEQGS